MKKIYHSKPSSKTALVIVKYLISISLAWAQEPTPFACSNLAYQVSGPNTSNSSLYSYNVSTGVRTLMGALPARVNSIGYNTLDNYIWGINVLTNQVVKIGANAALSTYSIPNLPAPEVSAYYNVGEVFGDGYLFIYSRLATRYYVVDINPARTATYLQLVDPTASYTLDAAPYGNTFIGATSLDISDIVYSSSNGLFNGIIDAQSATNAYRRFTINPVTQQVTITPTTIAGGGIQNNEKVAFGSVFIDEKPNTFYVFANTLGGFYKVDMTTNAATLISTAPTGGANNNDGASCPNTLLVTTISGTVFHDPDAGNVNNSTGNPNVAPSGLYANLIGTDGNVVAVAPVLPSGFYGFDGIPAGNYHVVLSTTNGTPGTASPVPGLPAGWVNTGEFNGAENTGNTAPADGISPVFTVGVNSTDINFGIQQPPVADLKTYQVPNAAFSVAPPAGYPALPGYQSIAASSANLTGYPSGGSLSGSDPEDCAGAGTCNTGTGTTFNIEAINASTQLYYDLGSGPVPIDVTGGPVSIPNFDVTKLVIYGATGSGTSSNPVGFTYSITDNGGATSSAAGYSIETESPMPVTLIRFDVRPEGNTVNLQWATSSEENSKGFEIERSANASAWTKIGFLPSLSSETVSSSRLDYHFADPNPLRRRSYYRLRMVDVDGKYTYSQIRVMASENSAMIYTYPNPAADELTINGLNGSEVIKVLDIFGRTLIEGRNSDGKNKTVLNIRPLPNGVYLIKTQMPDGSSVSQKVIKKK
ncbi:DUF6923 family protein [Dyadobacter sp. BHUBP1]|uniref:DUF6923 family protein n=1 Tax=Dyadobacter sp. BHUBP1 TaxID=3424178 RepID=UPI003D3352E8